MSSSLTIKFVFPFLHHFPHSVCVFFPSQSLSFIPIVNLLVPFFRIHFHCITNICLTFSKEKSLAIVVLVFLSTRKACRAAEKMMRLAKRLNSKRSDQMEMRLHWRSGCCQGFDFVSVSLAIAIVGGIVSRK